MKTAFIFPGQGAQKVGMGLELFESSAAARTCFEQADEALGESLSELIFKGPIESLTLTANTQPAVLTVSVAALNAFAERSDHRPDFVAGHSLGEFSALVACGAMGFADAVRTTRARGLAMQEAVPAGQGAMTAVIGLQDKEVEAVCQQVSTEEVVAPANFNSPDQIVISGHKNAVERAGAALTEAGAKRVIPLPVSAPFHSALMVPAAQQLAEVLQGIDLHQPQMPVVTNVEAAPNGDSDRIADLLVRQVTAPVRWTDSVRFMIDQGVNTFIEFGPGNVLAGLIRRTERSATVISVNSPDGLDKASQALEKLK